MDQQWFPWLLVKVAGGSQETLPASESEALVSRGISVSSLACFGMWED